MKRMAGEVLGLVAVMGLVAAVQYLPHMPGDPDTGPVGVYNGMFDRVAAVWNGTDDPYPVHVDEHLHMARAAQIDRQQKLDYDEPYTGAPQATDLMTVSGLRAERGFDLLIAQIHQLTGLSFPLLFRFMPAAWGAVLAATFWACLKPAPGALASAALLGIVPTTVHFMGPGFLVPSAFNLAWVPATMLVVTRGRGAERLAGLALLLTGAFFIHLALGTVVFAAAILTALFQPGTRFERLALAGATVLPLVWIVPPLYKDAVAVVSNSIGLPFEPAIFRTPGIIVFGLAAIGMMEAWYRPAEERIAHRVLSVLALVLALSMIASIRFDHHNDATYTRLVPIFFCCLAALAGLGAAAICRFIAGLAVPVPAAKWVAGSLTAVVIVAALVAPLQSHMEDPYYRVFDAPSWRAASTFANSGAGPDDHFLSHPWQAPVYNAVTGAKPWTVLYPGDAPVHGEDWDNYLASSGATPEWFKQRDIGYVIAPIPPNAPHSEVGQRVYRVS